MINTIGIKMIGLAIRIRMKRNMISSSIRIRNRTKKIRIRRTRMRKITSRYRKITSRPRRKTKAENMRVCGQVFAN